MKTGWTEGKIHKVDRSTRYPHFPIFMQTDSPTAAELAVISAQCSSREWGQLCQTLEFIEATADSIEKVAMVATQFLGREITPRPTEI